ncbi:MAG: PAS domain S-box protein [Candidatus Manganitrophus sp. SB1]|nr:PAS domain S-box protein [Candidatus Manganitrophus morganii]
MKAAPLQKRTPGASIHPLQKFIHSLFLAPSAVIVLSLTLTLTGIAWYFTQRSIENNAHARFDRRVVRASRAIEERIQTYIDTLLSMRGLFAVNQNITRADWRRYIESLQLQKRYPGIYDLIFVRYVPKSERAEFERQVRNDTSIDPKGYPDFSIHPEGDRPEYFPVEFTEPFSPIPVQFGFDIGSEPVRRQALEQARDTGHPASTGRIILVGTEEVGFSIRVPVYRNGLPQTTVEEKRRALIGFVASAFTTKNLMEEVLGGNSMLDFQFEIFDGGMEKTTNPLPLLTKERLLYDSNDILGANTGNNPPRYTQIASLDIAGRHWYIYFSTHASFLSEIEETLPFLILFGGATFSLLLSYITWSTTTARRRAIDLAESMTVDLRDSEERFRAIFDRAPSGIGVVDLEGRFIQVNQSYAAFLGYTREELPGRTFQEMTHPDDLTASMTVKEELAAGKADKHRFEKRYIRKDGRIVWGDITVSQINDPSGKPKYFVAVVDDITERKQMEEALRETNHTLQALIEASPLAIITLDLDGTVKSWNSAAQQIFGWSPEEVIGRFNPIVPKEKENEFKGLVKALLQGKVFSNLEVNRQRKNGSRVDVSLSTAPLRDGQGHIRGIVGILADMTVQKRAEEALRNSESRFRRVIDSNMIGIVFSDVNGNITEANDAFLQMVGYTREELRSGEISWKEMTPSEYHPLDMKGLDEMTATGVCAPFEKEFIRKDGSRVPVMIGAAFLEGSQEKTVGFVVDITDRKRADERLRESEEKYRLLFENNPYPMWVFDLETLAFLAVNEATVSRYGYHREEFLSMTITDLCPTEDIPLLLKSLPEINTRVGPGGIWRNRKKDRTVIDVEITADLISFSGRKAKLVLANDVTERLRAEEALRQSEEQYRLLFDRNPHPMWVVDPPTHAFLAVNEAAIRHYGYSREAFLRMTICDIRPPEEVPLLLGYLQEAAHRETSSDPVMGGVWTHRKKDGSLIEAEITWNLILFRGKEARLVLAEDVTESRKTERELQDSERRFRQLAENIHEIFWIVEFSPFRMLYISPAYEQIWGRACQSLYDQPKSFLDAVYPEDRVRVLDAMEQQGRGEPTDTEYRIIRTDGSVRWIRDRGFPIKDESGKVYRVAGVAEDITERRQAEQALRETNETLRALIHASPLAIFALDSEGKVKMWNPAAERLFGWREYEIFNQRFPILPVDQEEELDLLQKLVCEGKGFTGLETCHSRKDGSSVDISISVAPLPGSEPMMTGIVAVVADISDRKKTEEALRKSEERFHLATRATNDAVWDWDLITNSLWWNENLQTLFGYRPEEIEPGVESWTSRLHPEDKERVLSGIHTAIVAGDQLWSGEYRFRRGDGSYATVLDRGYIVRDAAGAPVRMIGAMMDITERNHAEEALRIKTDQLAAVTDAMTAYLDNRDWGETSSLLLRSALHQTESEYGFIGVVVEGPAFRILATEGIDVGPIKSRPFYTEALRMDGEQEYLELHQFDNLFGKVIQSGKVVLSNDAATDPRSGGIPPGHPSMRNFLGVPIIRENKVVGMIGIANCPKGYSGTEQAGLEILSHATGILYDNYRRREREIALENQQKSVEKELRRSQEQLRNLSSRLHSMVEEERTRISREIHDELGQLLTILKMELSWLKKRLPKKEALLRDRTKSMAKLVDTTVQTLRKISTELRPGVLDDLGLTAAIEWQVQEFQSRTGMRCHFTVRPEEILLDPDRSTAVFRIFQETLTNIVRHANADEVAILLEKTEENLILEVKDNGRGITQSQITNSKSLGLLGIRERALLWGGTVQINGVPGKGTIITVQIPLHQPTDAGMKS